MDALSTALAVLTAMITPTVLISACGTLILSTSARLGRVVDRVRSLSDRFEELAANKEQDALLEDRRAVIFEQLDKLTTRARLLQRCMTVFYLSLGIFVFTTVAIGIVAALAGTRYAWLPIVLALIGVLALAYGCVVLIFEARLALSTITLEMDFIWRLGQSLAPPHLVQEKSPHHNRLTLRRHL